MQLAHDVALGDDAGNTVGSDHHHGADVVLASPASSSVTVASGLIVTTAPPLPRNTSAIRIEASHRL